MTHPDRSSRRPDTRADRASARGLPGVLLDLFSSVRLGIVLMSVLFVYCSIGSAGLFYPVGLNIFSADTWRIEFVRQWRGIELTEFEWFHTWVFNGLIALICANIIVTTVRRIRLSRLNLGVWMIHTGIIVLCVGSVIYFGAKVEGDTPVIRRSVVIRWAKDTSAPPVVLPVLPGNRVEVPAPGGMYVFQIAEVNPNWPIQSEENKGKTAYSVAVGVTRPDRERYVRQLLAGYPQYTEDVLPGKGRFKKLEESAGEAIFDPAVQMSLIYEPQDRFWLKDSTALYARTPGSRDWSQRPIHGLPRYNDYLSDADDAWDAPGDPPAPVSPLNITVPAVSENDPLRDAVVRVTGYLRYAVPQSRLVPTGGASLFPVADLVFETPESGPRSVQLAALDPERWSAQNGLITMRWANDTAARARLRDSGERRLRVRIPALEATLDATVPADQVSESPDAPWIEIPGTDGQYSYRVTGAADNLALPEGGQSGGASSLWVLMVQVRTPEKTFTRWVADDPARTRDVPGESDPSHGGMTAPDTSVVMEYFPPLLSPVTIVASPGDANPWAIITTGDSPVREVELTPGTTVPINERLTMRLNAYSPAGRVVTRPAIVPVAQRDKDADRSFALSMAKVEITRAGRTVTRWLARHQYSFADESHTDAGLGRWAPELIRFDDGREVEVMLSRESRPLPARVALDDFILTSHVGGFEPGKMGSIRDWTSLLRFEDPSQPDGWSASQSISTNSPTEHKGYWYFQSFWDPPRAPRFRGDTGSGGMNFTGLGVGNREGVYVQLAGCCISVVGMLYAFYVKPILRRRMKQRALGEAAVTGRLAAAAPEVHANGSLEHASMVSPAERARLLDPEER